MNCSATWTLTVVLMTASIATANDSGWVLNSGTDKKTYQAISILSLSSPGSISDEYGVKQVHPRIEFICEPNGDMDIRARIDWQRFISSFNTEVTFDTGEEPVTLKLGVDRSNKVTSTRDTNDASAMIEALKGRDMLTVSVTPYSEGPLSVEFAIAGFDAALGKLKASCAT